MAVDRLCIGDVEILALADAIVDYPWPLTEIYPGVPLEALKTALQ